MFEKASRLKLRFATPVGNIATEDLWDLPLSSTTGVDLDSIAKALNKRVKASGEESFVIKRSKTNSRLELAFEVVKRVIEVKMKEAETAKNAAINKAMKEKIMRIRASKKDAELEAMSDEDLAKMEAEL